MGRADCPVGRIFNTHNQLLNSEKWNKPLMVIRYFNIIGVTFFKMEADSPLIINGYGILTLPIPPQGMEAIAGRNSQIIKTSGQINIF
jgi:hypothetical protein